MEWGWNLGANRSNPNSGGETQIGSYGEGEADLVYEWTSIGMNTGWHRVVRQSSPRGPVTWLLPTNGPPSNRITCDCGRCDLGWMVAGWTCPAQRGRDSQMDSTGYSWSQNARAIPSPGRPNPGTGFGDAPWTPPGQTLQTATHQISPGLSWGQTPWWETPDSHQTLGSVGEGWAAQERFWGEPRHGAPGSSGDRPRDRPYRVEQARLPAPPTSQAHRRRTQARRITPHLSVSWGANCGCDLCTLIRAGRQTSNQVDNSVLGTILPFLLGETHATQDPPRPVAVERIGDCRICREAFISRGLICSANKHRICKECVTGYVQHQLGVLDGGSLDKFV